jgi:hypothetical protein
VIANIAPLDTTQSRERSPQQERTVAFTATGSAAISSNYVIRGGFPHMTTAGRNETVKDGLSTVDKGGGS